MKLPLFEVDVFSTGPFSGNPLAVIADADELSTTEMQSIANWTNFSETVFLLSPTSSAADYRVRIFTPFTELSFAGHPTIGAARVFADVHNAPATLNQECGAGIIPLRSAGAAWSYATPPLLNDAPLTDAELHDTATYLGLSPADIVSGCWVDNGPGWTMVQLSDHDLLRSIAPQGRPAHKVGVVAFAPPGSADLYEVRAFNASGEDPVTGSLQGAVAQVLHRAGQVPSHFTAAQGLRVGRAGRVHIHHDGSDIWVGGDATIRVKGHIFV